MAAEGALLESCLAAVLDKLQKVPLALPCRSWSVATRTLGYRLLSRVACALHWLVRIPHTGFPYALFRILGPLGHTAATNVLRAPPCAHDELAQAFFAIYRDATFEEGSEELAVLRFLGDLVDIDIASVEARHASVRRLALRRGLRTWVADFEALAADFACRRVAASEAGPYVAATEGVAERHQTAADDRKQRKKKKTGGGGGGGPYRAFIHINYSGRGGMTAELWHEASVKYRQLSSEELDFYKNIGQLGLVAWRAGSKAFGSAAQQAPCPSAQPGTAPSTGFSKYASILLGVIWS